MMLTNELIPIFEMVEEVHCLAHCASGIANGKSSFDLSHFEKLCSKAREAWAFAVFETGSEEQLRRYFTYHMIVLTRMMDRDDAYWYNTGVLSGLTRLADHLYTYHHCFLEQNVALPRVFLQLRTESLRQKITFIEEKVRLITNQDLGRVLNEMLKEILELPDRKACTVGSLCYAESFIDELNDVLQTASSTNATALVTDKLIGTNFNHIRFFLYLEDQLKKAISKLPVTGRLEELRRQKVFFEQLRPILSYAVNWNSIGEMMRCWITEEIESIAGASQSVTGHPEMVYEKLGFNLSVAQLACLTRALFNAGVYISENINGIFTLSTRYFYSKKQANISKGSFSKEYYSISQKTAAHVLDLLQKMTASIRRDYFPVFVVIGVMHLS